MSESEFQLVRAAGFVAAAALALAIQGLRPHDPSYRARPVNLALWLINGVLVGLACGACAWTAAGWAEAARTGLFNRVHLPAWATVLLSIAALDLVSYAWHRANHRIPLLWRFHQVHHSDRCFTVSTAVRFHPGEILLSLPVRLLAIVALGAPVAGVIAFEVVFAFSNLFEHGNIRLPLRLEQRLAGLLVTPALHRRHHACRRPELDSNFATIFSFWDRLLGTFGDNSSAARFPIGLPGAPSARTLPEVLLLPLTAGRDADAPS
ncbi:MAG: sterol desaturase family protein [Deltaproteobacteria bacterium]|nr:sterol desaturase family protein [Deltaproteobacteria bacterium]